MPVLTGTRNINGKPSLPKGYALAFVPRTAKVAPLEGDHACVPDPQYDIIKGLVSLARAFYVFYTLYQARGDQVSRYGYAAFGLTVLPYAVMSTINLIGAFFAPTFDGLYLVQSDTLLEASGRAGANFVRVVGTLLPADATHPVFPVSGKMYSTGLWNPTGTLICPTYDVGLNISACTVSRRGGDTMLERHHVICLSSSATTGHV
ncbi:hypothetical protein B0H13DRAFT_1618046 [Mycena leptocephala]|nr:hypothetical protein B0H13DRAFT_1618046 [Mycena leptocephala]